MSSGDPIFRNQPPHTFFDKSFQDPTDALYLCLNEIHPFYLKVSNCAETPPTYSAPVDPRTKQMPSASVFDYTESKAPDLFQSPKKSALTSAEHKAHIRLLRAQCLGEPIEEADYLVVQKCRKKLQKEKLEMQKFIQTYHDMHRVQIYQPFQRLSAIYRRSYEHQMKQLLAKENCSIFYNTHCGLPHLRICKSSTDAEVVISTVEMVERRGYVPVWTDLQNINYSHILMSLEKLTELYEKSQRSTPSYSEEEIVRLLSAKTDPEAIAAIYIPLETLLFLLTAGTYVDLPLETMFHRLDATADHTNLLLFEEMTAARNFGWHTATQVIERACRMYYSYSEAVQWASIDNESPVIIESDSKCDEINGNLGDDANRPFRPVLFDDFMDSIGERFEGQKCTAKLRSSRAMVKWQLKSSESDMIDIFTSFELPPIVSKVDHRFLGSFDLKLEYKPQFGCEVMTLYELMKHWLLLTFMQRPHDGQCIRISAVDFTKQLDEHLRIEMIEQQLTQLYHVNMLSLVSNLHVFFNLLLNFGDARFLLRYNPKFKDKFLACMPATELNSNSFHFDSVTTCIPTELQFMTESTFLPIADQLCSTVHLTHNTMPCAFSHKAKAAVGRKGQRNRAEIAIINDRTVILERHRARLEEKEKKHAVLRKRVKQTKKKRKQKANKKALERQKSDRELEERVMNDF